MIKTIKLEEAIGTELAHDITEIRPGEFKGPAFRKGHTVCPEDVCRMQRLGKNHLYVIDLEEDEIHENEAAALLAAALAGEGVVWENNPREGKINLYAGRDGLLQVGAQALAAFNLVDEVMCATLHSHTLVKTGELIGATRAIPLVMKRVVIERAAAIARQNGAVLAVRPLRKARAGLVITGNEVYHGLIQDRFAPILAGKLERLGSQVAALAFAPDDADTISAAIRSHLNQGCDLLLLSGGMSVDPDDVTRHAIRQAGATEFHYGAAVLPGAMFLVAYLGETPLLGVPACALHHPVTALDLVLPRILAGERLGKLDLALLGHGGLCRDCPQCSYPHCPFGKGVWDELIDLPENHLSAAVHYGSLELGKIFDWNIKKILIWLRFYFYLPSMNEILLKRSFAGRLLVAGLTMLIFLANGLAKEGAAMAITSAAHGRPPLDVAAAAVKTETATFALGWFWGVEARFGSIQGVVRTRVGYTGGAQANPTYHHLGDHTESVQVDYDPARVSYEELLRVFWESHSPGVESWSRQYKAAVFYHNEAQKRLALKSRDETAARLGSRVYTEVLPAGEFYLAEDYHQKYFLRQSPELLAELKEMYPTSRDLVDSPAAARVNGYLAGSGPREDLQREIHELGLSAAGQRQLEATVASYGKSKMRHVCPVN